jgi:hypothetical protein
MGDGLVPSPFLGASFRIDMIKGRVPEGKFTRGHRGFESRSEL